jgi:hypothetical protein
VVDDGKRGLGSVLKLKLGEGVGGGDCRDVCCRNMGDGVVKAGLCVMGETK